MFRERTNSFPNMMKNIDLPVRKIKGKERIKITDFEDRRRTNVYNSSRRGKKKGTD